MRARFMVAACVMIFSCQSTPSGGATDASSDVSGDVPGDVSGDAGGDASVDAAQDQGTDSESKECNSLVNVGAAVRQMFVATRAATGDGGVIVNGTYVLTAAVVYSGPDGSVGPTGTTFTDTLAMLNGGAYERVVSAVNDAGLDGSPIRQSGRYTSDGGGLQVTQTCPPDRQPFTSYDSDGTRFRIYAPATVLGPGVMFEYTRR